MTLLNGYPCPFRNQRRRDLQHVIGAAGVAAGVIRDLPQNLIAGRETQIAQATFAVLKRPPQQQHNLLFRERLQNVHTAAR